MSLETKFDRYCDSTRLRNLATFEAIVCSYICLSMSSLVYILPRKPLFWVINERNENEKPSPAQKKAPSRGRGRENGLILLSPSFCLNVSALTSSCRSTDAAAEPHGK